MKNIKQILLILFTSIIISACDSRSYELLTLEEAGQEENENNVWKVEEELLEKDYSDMTLDEKIYFEILRNKIKNGATISNRSIENYKRILESEYEIDASYEFDEFKDIESMGKAESIEEAFEGVFGQDRLFNHEEIRIDDNPRYNEDYSSRNIGKDIYIPIEFKAGIDTRIEMIDFLHYLQYSDLANSDNDNLHYESFNLNMSVFEPIKPGMNLPEPYQKWSIDSTKIEVMDFTNKKKMLEEIHFYGEFEGYNP